MRKRCGYERFYFTLGFPLRGKLAAKPTEEGRRLSRCPFPLFCHFVTPSPWGGRQGWGSGRLTPPRYVALFPSSVTS